MDPQEIQFLGRGFEAAHGQFKRGGLEVLDATLAQFTERLTRENHTLKRSLTDPRLFSGIGNAYSDEILHRAKLSPVKHTRRLSEEETARRFYSGLLGMEEISKPAALAKRGGCWFKSGVVQIHVGVEHDFAPPKRPIRR